MSLTCSKDYSITVGGTMALAVDVNPSCRADIIVFTATVQGLGPAPTGNVAFKEGITVLATSPVVAGVATWNSANLSVATHNITATFTGTGAFAGMVINSNSVSQQINCCYANLSQVPTGMATIDAQPCIDWWIAWLGVNPFAPHPAGAAFRYMTVFSITPGVAVSWSTPAPYVTYNISLTLFTNGSAGVDSINGCNAQFSNGATFACPWNGVPVHFTAVGGSGVCSGHPFPGGGFDLSI